MLDLDRSAADADLDAPGGEHVESGHHLGQQGGMAEVVVEHKMADS